MAKCIENPADCKKRAVIRFLQAKNIQPTDIHRQVCEVYGEGAMSDSMVRRRCRQFEVVEIMCMTTNAAVAPAS